MWIRAEDKIMLSKTIQDVTIECVKGNIVEQDDIDAVVNAANAWLRIGGGVAGAVHRAAGSRLEQACRKLAPIRPGQAVITEAFNMPNSFVIHCLGPVYGSDKPSDKLLADCYRNSLQLAEQNRISSIAFPAISTGAFGYPVDEAMQVAAETVVNQTPKLSAVKLIRFVLFSQRDYDAAQTALEQAVSSLN